MIIQKIALSGKVCKMLTLPQYKKYLIRSICLLVIIFLLLTIISGKAEDSYANKETLPEELFPLIGPYTLYIANTGPPGEDLPYYLKQPPSTAGTTIQSDLEYLLNNPEAIDKHNEEKKKDYIKSNIAIINTLSEEPVNIIEWPVPNVMPFWLAMSDQGILYVADSANNITIIDTEKPLCSSSYSYDHIPIVGGYIVCDIALGNSDKTLFCALASASNPSIGVIDTTTKSLIKMVDLPISKEEKYTGQPWGIETDEHYVYVVKYTDTNGEVIFINSIDYTIEASVTVGEAPFYVAVTPDRKKLYVTNRNSGSVSVIDIIDKKVITTITGQKGPVKIAITPDGKKVYVTNRKSDSVSVIDTETQAVLTNIPVGKSPGPIAISKDGKMAFVGNQNSYNITMIDIETDTVITTITPCPESTPFDLIVR